MTAASTMRNRLYHQTPLSRVRLATCTLRTRPKNHPVPPYTTIPRYPCTARNLSPSPHHQCQTHSSTVFHPASISSSPLPRLPIRPTRRDTESFASARFSRRNESIAETCVQPASTSDVRHSVCLSRRRVCTIHGLIVNNASHVSRSHACVPLHSNPSCDARNTRRLSSPTTDAILPVATHRAHTPSSPKKRRPNDRRVVSIDHSKNQKSKKLKL